MADVGATELSHKQERGFVEKHGVISKRPDRNSIGPESVARRDKSWDIAGIRKRLETEKKKPIYEEDKAEKRARDKSIPYIENFDDAHLWHKVSEGKGEVTWDADAEDRLEKHEGRWPTLKWFLGKIPFPDRNN